MIEELVYIDEIEEYEDEYTEHYVYDISTKNSGNFYANNILVHNTDSIFLHLDDVLKMELKEKYEKAEPKEKAEIVINIVKKIAKYINDYIIPNVMILHNTNDNDNEYVKWMLLNFKEEFVIRRGLYCMKEDSKSGEIEGVKKRYATWLIREGNNDIDEIDVKGMAIKRADTPAAIKDYFGEVIEYILRTDDLDKVALTEKILTRLEEYKDLVRQGDQRAGVPGAYSLREYKKEPISVNAMKIYNILFSEIFRAGDRSYRFNIKDINKDKIENFGDKHRKIKETGLIGKNNRFGEIDVIAIPRNTKLDIDIFTPDMDKMVEIYFKKFKNITDVMGINVKHYLEAELWW